MTVLILVSRLCWQTGSSGVQNQMKPTARLLMLPRETARTKIAISAITLLNTKSTGTLLNVPLTHKLPSMTHTRKLVYYLRTRTTKSIPTTTCTSQMTHT